MIDHHAPLLLGSASPRRREILETLGLPLRVVAPDVDERAHPGEPSEGYLVRMVQAKLDAVARLALPAPIGGVLVADTVVVVNGEVLGKPEDARDAERMLRRLEGRTHEVHTRFAVASPAAPASPLSARTVSTRVAFRALTDDEIRGYAASGEGSDKAGGYAMQGLGSFAITRIEGSPSAVIGLPACEVVLALLETGLLARFPLPSRPAAP